MAGSQTDTLRDAIEPKIAGSARRQRVIDGAAATFARFGYHGVGTRAIAETLGIKAASLYCHISSKEDALEEVCRQGIAVPLTLLEKAIATETTMAGRLRKFFADQTAFFHEHGDYVAVYLHERRHLPAEARERIDAISRQHRAALDRLFTQARESGELHPSLSPKSASLISIGTIRNINQFAFEDPIRNLDQFITDAVDTMIRGLSA